MANRNSKITGKFPEFGAIFMSNGSTRVECLHRNLFGLPSTHADFVKSVKEGMILFLFDYEKRKLYGVFKATSDGELNIVSNAYGSTGKLFPSQVKVSRIWNCHPLYEDEFHHAIRSNYFSTNKFNYGLSYDQVYKLLRLFDSRKVRHVESQRCSKQEVGEKGHRYSHKKQKVEKDECNHTEKARKKRKMDIDVKPESNVDPLTCFDKCPGLEGDSQSSASRKSVFSCKASQYTFPEASCFQSSAAYVSSYSSTSSHGLATRFDQTTEKRQVKSGEDASGLYSGTHFDHTTPKCQVTSGEDASSHGLATHFDQTTEKCQINSGENASGHDLGPHFDLATPKCQVTSWEDASSHGLAPRFDQTTKKCQVNSGEDASGLDLGTHFYHTTPKCQITLGGDAPSHGLGAHFDHSTPIFQVTSGGDASSYGLGTRFDHTTENCQVHSGEDVKQLDIHISARSLQGEIGDDFIPLSLSSDGSDTEDNIPQSSPCEPDPTESKTFFKPRFLLKNAICRPSSPPIEDQKDLASENVSPIPDLSGLDFPRKNVVQPLITSALYTDQHQSSAGAFPLSEARDCRLNGDKDIFSDNQEESDRDDNDHCIHVKSLYSDSPEKRDSVFSRMKISSLAHSKGNESMLKGRKREEACNKEDDKPVEIHEEEKRGSVFSRLIFSSKPQDTRDKDKADESVHKVRTEKKDCGTKDEQSVTEVMEELQKRFGNGSEKRKRARSSRKETKHTSKDRGSVFERLSSQKKECKR